MLSQVQACVKSNFVSSQTPRVIGRAEAHLFALACSDAPDGRERWTMRLLADRMVELGRVDSVSYETVRRTLKKTRTAKPA
jgi:Homeodomain-like domain